jgi:hypothetical protein
MAVFQPSEPTLPAFVNTKYRWAEWVGKLPTTKTPLAKAKIADPWLITGKATRFMGRNPHKRTN